MSRLKANMDRSVNRRRKTKRDVSSKAAFVLLCIFFIFEYLRPQDSYFGFLSVLRIPMLLTITLFIVFLKNEKEFLKDKLVILMFLFLAEIAISVVFATNTYFVWRGFKGMALLVVIVMVIPVVLNNMKKFDKFLNFWLVMHVLITLYVLSHAGRGPGGFLADENDVALTLVMAIPIALAMIFQEKLTKKQKIFYIAVVVVLVAGVVASLSRGGFLGLLSIVFVYWWYSQNKFKTLFKTLLLIAILGYPVYKMIPEQYLSEVSTITDSSDKTRNSRFLTWGLGWQMFLDNPILGVGAMNYGWNVVEYQIQRDDFDPDARRLLGGRAAHSLYFTLLSELGIVGAIIYFYIVYLMIKKLRFIMKLAVDNDEYHDVGLVAKSFLVSLFAFFVTGTFISVLYYPPFWYLLGLVLTLDIIVRQQYMSGQRENTQSSNELLQDSFYKVEDNY